MKQLLIIVLSAAIFGACGWLLKDTFTDAASTAKGSAYMQLFRDIRIASEKKFLATGTFYRSLLEIPKNEISFSDGGTPELLESIVYVADPDLKRAIMCGFFFREMQAVQFTDGKTLQIFPPSSHRKAEQGAAANP